MKKTLAVLFAALTLGLGSSNAVAQTTVIETDRGDVEVETNRDGTSTRDGGTTEHSRETDHDREVERVRDSLDRQGVNPR